MEKVIDSIQPRKKIKEINILITSEGYFPHPFLLQNLGRVDIIINDSNKNFKLKDYIKKYE